MTTLAVIVLGENDAKPNGSWPGRQGAESIARQLAERWQRSVQWSLPPDSSKDIRAWMQANGHGVDAGARFLELIQDQTNTEEPPATPVPYRATPAGLVYDKPTKDGPVPVPLANFTATIVADTTYDDGAEQWCVFEIEADLSGRRVKFELPAARFGSMSWAHEHLGAEAVVYAGFSAKDHTRAAIQLLSRDVLHRTVYAHTGWRKIDGEWVYLHGGGAIGSNGAIPGIDVSLGGRLQHYTLSSPPSSDRVRDAVRASLRFLDLAPASVTYPLFATILRAVLGPSDLTVHVTGPTGHRKTELAALAQQHFGPEMHAKNLPGSWSSTENALEAQAFTLADTLFVIDDFVPEGGTFGAARLHAKAARVLRAQGNRSGRDRMRPDSTLRPTKYPRGAIMSTGEEIPHGHSLRARMFIVEVEPDDVRLDRLTDAQSDARDGLYAEAMAGYVRWLAPRYERLREQLRTKVAELRGELLGEGRHGRTCEIAATLIVAFQYFTTFAVEVGALTESDAADLLARARQIIVEGAEAQAEHHRGEEPLRVFADLLRSALSSGRAFVRGLDGGTPADAARWGWERRDGRQNQESDGITERWAHVPSAECVGNVNGDDLYLQPEAAHRVARDADRDGRFLIGVKTLGKRLREAGEIVSHEEGRSTTRVTIGANRAYVLHVRTCYLFPLSESSQSSQSSHSPATDSCNADSGSISRRGSPVERENRATRIEPDGSADGGSTTSGAIGAIPGEGMAGGAERQSRDSAEAQDGPTVTNQPRADIHDGPDYPPPGARLGPPTHFLDGIPVICRMHLSDEHKEGFRWEILRYGQPEGDGHLGWAVVSDDSYVSIVRERGIVRTLTVPTGLTSHHLKERRR